MIQSQISGVSHGRPPVIPLNDEKVSSDCQFRNGNQNVKATIAVAAEGGTEWFAVEQDTCRGDPFDSLQQSFDYISSELVEG